MLWCAEHKSCQSFTTATCARAKSWLCRHGAMEKCWHHFSSKLPAWPCASNTSPTWRILMWFVRVSVLHVHVFLMHLVCRSLETHRVSHTNHPTYLNGKRMGFLFPTKLTLRMPAERWERLETFSRLSWSDAATAAANSANRMLGCLQLLHARAGGQVRKRWMVCQAWWEAGGGI